MLRIPNKAKAQEVREIKFTEKEWKQERTHFLTEGAGEGVLPTKQHIFIIESHTIRDDRHPTTALDLLVILLLFTTCQINFYDKTDRKLV